MSTDKQAVEAPSDDAAGAGAEATAPGDTRPASGQPSERPSGQPSERPSGQPSEPEDAEQRRPSWWHRDHPTFAALTGFFTGLVFVAVIPAVYVGILSLMFDNDRVEDLFPFVLVTLVVPLALVANKKTRRFGTYFWIGMLLTAIVVVGVSALVLWYLVEHQN